ncbi:DsbA family protein [Microseira sp. BLCC-F43]|jgi:2-hydroxychromene-2-carboxylate isomerase|uniref:DsbA family protein n=1 Tax=Microseira sp. BLCC-F43 TaxID=3153602 RepID=UPI0035B98F10
MSQESPRLQAGECQYKIPFHEPKPLSVKPQDLALATLAAGSQGLLVPYSQALFDAIFAKGLAIDDAILTAIATNLGISQTDFQSHLKSNDTQNQLDLLTEEAFNRGVFGVPTFLFGSEMFWGNDRLVLLQHYLKKSS